MARFAKLLGRLLALPLFDFVPKGSLTRIASWLQVVFGLGLLANILVGWIESGGGTIPDDKTLEMILGLILAGNGAQGAGLRRALPKIAPLLLVALVGSGCAFRLGPGEDGWIEYQIWTQANLEVQLPFGSVCVGCLETASEPEDELGRAP